MPTNMQKNSTMEIHVGQALKRPGFLAPPVIKLLIIALML